MIALPQAFVDRIKHDNFVSDDLLEALDAKVPTAIRLNPLKREASPFPAEPIVWSRSGFWLHERPVFTLDPTFHAGSYYPQEAGSQVLSAVYKQLNDLPEQPLVLDLCAAPGGKSTLLLSEMEGKGVLVANEIILNRSLILKENIQKWGYSNVLVTNNKPSDFEGLVAQFDLIVIDAPCSGEGMFRKDERARTEWSAEAGTFCGLRQQEIISAIWPSLKQGAYLFYSTCTFNPIENEECINWILSAFDAELVDVKLPDFEVGRGGVGFYAFPNKLNTEGFYCCVLRKRNAENQQPKKIKGSDLHPIDKKKIVLNQWLKDENQTVLQWKDFLFAFPEAYVDWAQVLKKQLKIVTIGTELGEWTNKGLIPHQALALQPTLVSENIQRIPLSKEQALNYLQGNTFPLEGEKGHALVTYEGITLGWIKHLGNRFNNLYPKEWRIKMRID